MEGIVDKFSIREAKNTDIREIIDIDKELGGLYPQLETKIKDMLEDDDSYFLVANFDEDVVGYAGGIIRHTEFGEDDPIGYITHVGLREDFKSKGMGRMLGDKLLETMGEKAEVFRTILSFDRIDLQEFFNHLGFNRTDLLVYENTSN